MSFQIKYLYTKIWCIGTWATSPYQLTTPHKVFRLASHSLIHATVLGESYPQARQLRGSNLPNLAESSFAIEQYFLISTFKQCTAIQARVCICANPHPPRIHHSLALLAWSSGQWLETWRRRCYVGENVRQVAPVGHSTVNVSSVTNAFLKQNICFAMREVTPRNGHFIA
jgi:hypothetical protein